MIPHDRRLNYGPGGEIKLRTVSPVRTMEARLTFELISDYQVVRRRWRAAWDTLTRCYTLVNDMD